MLWNASSLEGFAIRATDGEIGSVSDLLFDDHEWTVRWLVIDTGAWLPGRKVLLPSTAIVEADPAARVVTVDVTRQQVADSPGIDKHAPVSRQHESDLFSHYAWQPYWVGYGPSPAMPFGEPATPQVLEGQARRPGATEDPNLRSVEEVTGYHVEAKDGEIGHIEELLIDSEGWAVRYIAVDTRNWWPGKKVLVLPRAFTSVDWSGRRIHADLTREQIRNGPEYDPTQSIDRSYEERYFGYYGYHYYWK